MASKREQEFNKALQSTKGKKKKEEKDYNTRNQEVDAALKSRGYTSKTSVDENYINSYISDVSSYLESAQKDYEKVNYGNSAQYSKQYVGTAYDKALDYRAKRISEYLHNNKNAIDSKTYEELSSYLNESRQAISSTVQYFSDSESFYNQFETEEDYNKYLRKDFAQGIIDKMSEQERLDLVETASNLNKSKSFWNTAKKYIPESLADKWDETTNYLGLNLSDDKNFFDPENIEYVFTSEERAKAKNIAEKYNITEDQAYDVAYELINNPDNNPYLNLYENLPEEDKALLEDTYYLEMNLSNSDEDYYSSWEYETKRGPSANPDAIKIHNNKKTLEDKYGKEAAKALYRIHEKGVGDYVYGLVGDYAEGNVKNAGEATGNSVMSVPLNIVGGFMSPFASAQGYIDSKKNQAYGLPNADTLDTSNPYYLPTKIANAERQTVTNTYDANVDVPIFGETDVFDFLYNTGMSGIDSLAASATGGAGVVALGGSAASNSAIQSAEKGVTPEQAIVTAVGAGVAEYIFEKISLGNFKAWKEVDTKLPRDVVKNVLKSVVVNASEESLTETANILTDTIVNQEKSDLMTNITYYESQGLSTKDAVLYAVSDSLKQIGEAGISGGLMGFGFSGAGSVSSYASNISRANKIGKAVKSEGLTDAVVEAARTSDDKLVQKYVQKINKKGIDKASTVDVGSVARELMKGGETTKAALETIGSYTRPINLTPAEKVQITHPTLGKSDGKVVSLYSVEAVKDGKIIVKDSEGDTQTLDINKLEGKAKDLWTYASKHFNDAQAITSFVNNYDGQNIDIYSRNYKAVFDLASVGITAPIKGAEKIKALEGVVAKEHDVSSNEGETLLKETNEVVSIKKIASTNGKAMSLELTDGRVVSSKDVSYGSQGEALVYETIANMEVPVDVANTLVSMYSPHSGQSAVVFAKGIEEAYRYGYFSIPKAEMLSRASFAPELTEKQREDAYKLGSIMSTSRAKESPKTAGKRGAVGKGRVIFKNGKMKLTERQKTSVKALEVIAEVTGLKIVLFESPVVDGKRVGENGSYDPETGVMRIDLHAGISGDGLMLFTAAHELTHHIKNWSPVKFKILADFLMEQYGEKGVSVDDLVKRQIAKAKANGRTLTYEQAHEEVVCDSLEAMLADGAVIEKLKLLATKDKSLVQKMTSFLKNLVAKIKKAYAGLKPDSAEGKLVAEMVDATEDLHNLFAEALMDATENYTSAESDFVSIDNASESASPKLSERTWTASDYVVEREATAKMLANALGVTKKKALAYIDNVNSIAKMIADDRARLDYEASPFGSAFVSNSEYGGSFDFTTLCKKRRLYTGTFSEIQKRLGDVALTPDDILAIRNMLIEKHKEATCGLCYVEGSRANMGKFAKEFIRLYKRDNPDAWTPSMYDVNTPDGVESMKINHPEAYEQYEYFWNHYGKLQPTDKALFASQQKPKLYESRKEYKGEILHNFSKDSTVAKKNLNGGIRMQSFSDFEIVHLIDTMQIIMDMASVGLAGQAYTKVPEFADAFGNTGLKINLSLIAKGVDADGNLIFDDREGMPHETAFGLRNKYSSNVGTIIVVFTDEQLYSAMADSRIDFIIPFHRSQWKKGQYGAMGLPQGTKDYTYMQNEKLIKPTYHEYRGRMVKDKASNYMPNEYWDFSKSGKENAEAYLAMCAENNKRPKFYKLLDYDGKGTYSLKKDGSTDGYWKLLIDFKMYDNNGVGSPQQAVTPTFSMDEAIEMLNEYKGGHQSYPVAYDVVDSFVDSYGKTADGRKLSDRDSDYMTAVESGDMETAQRMVDEVAEKNGYTPEHLYHGTNEFGFTQFDMDNSDDGISFFVSDKQSVSQGYMSYYNNSTDAYHNAPRRIGKKSDMQRTALSRTSSVDKVIDTLKKQFPYYAEARQATESDIVSYLQKDISVNDAVSSANELLKLDLLDDVRALVESVVNASKDGSYNAWKNVADKYSEFDDVYDVTENIRQWNQALDLWDNIKRGVYTSSDIVQEDSVYHNGKVESKSALIKRYNNSLQGESNGMYDLYANHSNQLVIEGNGSYWIDLPLGKMAQQYNDWWVNVKGNPALEGAIYTNGDTRSISEFAKAMGYHSVRFNNIYDSGASEGSGELSTVYSFFYPSEDIKSADPVTYDDDGNVIPLSKRFDSRESDIRYSDREISFGRLTQERIDDIIADSGAGKRVDYARAWITNISPSDFIDLTLPYESRIEGRDAFDEKVQGDHGNTMSERDYIADLKNSRMMPRLSVDIDTGKVIGHDGRHRMRALEKAGASRTPVEIVFYKDGSLYKGNNDGVRLEAIDFKRLTSQFDDVSYRQTRAYIHDVIPLNEDHRADIEREFRVRAVDEKYFGAIAYSDRDPDSTSPRNLLANALEGTVSNDVERKKLAEYKNKIDLMNAEEEKLTELRKQIKEASFSKGKRGSAKLKQLKEDATKTANRINTYDRQLLNLESTTALKNVLEREKKKATERQKQKDKEILADYRKRAKEREQEIIDRYQESRKKATEGRHKTEMRNKIKKVVSELNQYLLHGTKDKHVMIGMQKAVAEALSIVNMDTVGADDRVARYDALIAEATDPDVIESLTASRDRIKGQGDRLSEKLTSLQTAYSNIKDSSDPLVSNAYDEVIEAKIASVADTVGNTPLRDMSMSQLESVYDLYKMVLTNIRNANKLFKAEKQATIEEIGINVDGEIKEVTKQKDRMLPIMDFARKMGYKELKPIYFFRMLGSKTMTSLYESVRNGQNTWYRDAFDAKTFRMKTEKEYGYKKWDFKKKHSFEAKSGKTFDLTLSQIMSIYAFSRREQALDHLIKGGIVYDDAVKVKEKKKGIPLSYVVNTSDAFNLSEVTLGEIIDTLSPEQKAFVETMQAYLSDTMGEKGNEVSLELYGVKMFKEKNYFPLKSSQYYMAFTAEEAGEVKIKNSSFSKETVKHANNPIVLSDFMDVWTSHVNDMAMYHAFVLPLEDFTRVYNYRTPTGDNFETTSIKSTIHNHFTESANEYIRQLLKDINGGSVSGVGTQLIDKMIGLAKKGAVFASASVVVQQPSAIARAMAYVNPKYFANISAFNFAKHNRLWEECKRYAPVAGIKEMGYFDTSVGQTGIDWIKSDEYETYREKFFAFLKDGEQRGAILDDVLSKAPAMADELSWVALWEAVKKETKKTTDLKVGSEEFFEHCGRRFTEVIDLTQVYDSVFSRSELMRSKDRMVKAATAFMSEPTTQVNMLFDAGLQLKRNGRKGVGFVASVVGSVVASVVLNSLLKSFVLAGRDDDEDETFLEKYIASFTGDVLNGLNPLTLIPFVKDVISIFQGYSVDRMDMSVIDALISSVLDFGKDTKTDYEKWTGLIGSVSQLFGIPAKNIIRDFNTAVNTFNTITNGNETTKTGVKVSVEEGLSGTVTALIADKLAGVGFDTSKGKQYYDAVMSGDTTHADRIIKSYGDAKKADTAIVDALKDYEPRVVEAAQAQINGDSATRIRLAKEIIADGFKQDYVVKAINGMINKLNKGEGEAYNPKAQSLYSKEDYFDAAYRGNANDARTFKEEIIKVDMENKDKTREEAEKSFNNSFRSSVEDAVLAGELTADKATKMLTTFGGLDEDTASEKAQYYMFKRENPSVKYNWQSSTVADYNEVAKPNGISVAVFDDYLVQKSECTGTDTNGDGKTDSGSKKAQVLVVIDSLPISSRQKDTLYRMNGWAESKLYEAPWH